MWQLRHNTEITCVHSFRVLPPQPSCPRLPPPGARAFSTRCRADNSGNEPASRVTKRSTFRDRDESYVVAMGAADCGGPLFGCLGKG
jgi:hypothetical protein